MPKDFVRENGRVKIIHRERYEMDFSEKKYKLESDSCERVTTVSFEMVLDTLIKNREEGRPSCDDLRIRDLNERERKPHPLA